MKMEYWSLASEGSEQARTKVNRELLSAGVVGIKCTFAGKFTPEVMNEKAPHISVSTITDKITSLEEFGDMELYENGAGNIYVRHKGEEHAHAFIRVRPEFDDPPPGIQSLIDKLATIPPDVVAIYAQQIVAASMKANSARIVAANEVIRTVVKAYNHTDCGLVADSIVLLNHTPLTHAEITLLVDMVRQHIEKGDLS